jgi:signal transduction histidine kinase
MSAIARLRIAFVDATATAWRDSMIQVYRRCMSLSLTLKWTLTLAAVALVGYADLSSGDELSFSIFYLLPIAYATWCVDARAGCLTAIMSSVVWFSVDASFRSAYSNALIPVWNGVMRLLFFFLGVVAVTLVKRTEAHLLREISLRTLSLSQEISRRRELEREMVELSAREQVRVAQDLHDGLGQYLSALAFHTRMLADDLRQHHSPHLPQAERIMTLVRTTNQITRNLDRALRVPEAGGDFFGIIRGLVVNVEQLTGVRCELDAEDETVAFDDFCTIMLYRIVQEALNNAVKHANPRLIRVSLKVANAKVNVTIDDDGHGITAQPDRDPGIGMRVMKLRAELIGAQLDFGAVPAGGCRVHCSIPAVGHGLKGLR